MRSRWIIVPAIGLGLLLSSCSGSSASSTASGTSGSTGPGERQHAPLGVDFPAGSGAGKSAAGAASPAMTAPPGATGFTSVHLSPTSIIYTAELTVRAHDVTTAADQAAQIAEAAGGYVAGESLTSGSDASATVTLKIPAAGYPQTLNGLATQLGKRLSLQQQAQDVTQQVTDVNSQVTSYQTAISQLRALLSHAGSVSDLLSVQNQINNEETGLEQLLAEQRTLGQQVSYATVTVTIVPAPAPPAPHHNAAGTPGLTRGFKSGWHALRVAFSWTLAVLGALAPFLAIAAAAALVAFRTRRWLLHRRAQPE